MKFHIILFFSLALSACGSAGENGSDPADAATADGSPEVAGAVIAPDYLEGQWCYSHIIAGDEKSDEMINYIFSKDGTLLYQNSAMSEIDKTGSYAIDGNGIKILPTLAAFDTQFESMSPDKFVLKMAYGQMHWSRGACTS